MVPTVMTILYLQPQQQQQSATTAQPKFYSPASTMQWHRMPAGVCWKMLRKGAGVLASEAWVQSIQNSSMIQR
jgi:hypothetical protein